MIVVYISEITTKPMPPMINNAETIRGADTEWENRLRFSEKLEKPALQNADTEWKNAWPRAVIGLNLSRKAKYNKIVPTNSRTMVILKTRQANRFKFS